MVENGREQEPIGKLLDTRRSQLAENKGPKLLRVYAEGRRQFTLTI